MKGPVMAYLDACAGVTDEQWLGIDGDGEDRERADFWTIAQVVPSELREAGEWFAQRWIAGKPPETALECWFRRVVVRVAEWKKAPVEPWVVLLAMAHAYAGRNAPSPAEFARKAGMPMQARDYGDAVSVARDEASEGSTRERWVAGCNG